MQFNSFNYRQRKYTGETKQGMDAGNNINWATRENNIQWIVLVRTNRIDYFSSY